MGNELVLRIYGGSARMGLDRKPLVAVGAAPSSFQPFPPTIVNEPLSWMIVHAQEYTLYALHSRKYLTAEDEEGQLLVCLFISPAMRLADDKSPLQLLESLYNFFSVQGAPDGHLPKEALDPSPFRVMLGLYSMEERPRPFPIMQGPESASFRVANTTQLDALMRYSNYDILAKIGRLELGFHCVTTVQIPTGGPRPKEEAAPAPKPEEKPAVTPKPEEKPAPKDEPKPEVKPVEPKPEEKSEPKVEEPKPEAAPVPEPKEEPAVKQEPAPVPKAKPVPFKGAQTAGLIFFIIGLAGYLLRAFNVEVITELFDYEAAYDYYSMRVSLLPMVYTLFFTIGSFILSAACRRKGLKTGFILWGVAGILFIAYNCLDFFVDKGDLVDAGSFELTLGIISFVFAFLQLLAQSLVVRNLPEQMRYPSNALILLPAAFNLLYALARIGWEEPLVFGLDDENFLGFRELLLTSYMSAVFAFVKLLFAIALLRLLLNRKLAAGPAPGEKDRLHFFNRYFLWTLACVVVFFYAFALVPTVVEWFGIR